MIILNLIGFEVDINSLKNVPEKSIIITSHTSIYDFIFCSLVYHAYFKERLNVYFMMKDEFANYAKEICKVLFPYTRIIPINNESNIGNNVVNNVINELKEERSYALCIAPEGTRKCVNRIRSGFYYIGRDLNIPVIYCGIDFSRKIIKFEPPRKMGEHIENEYEWFKEMCRKYVPLYPENCYFTKDYYNNDSETRNSQFENSNPLFNQNQNDNDSSINIMEELDNEIEINDDNNSYVSHISIYE